MITLIEVVWNLILAIGFLLFLFAVGQLLLLLLAGVIFAGALLAVSIERLGRPIASRLELPPSS